MAFEVTGIDIPVRVTGASESNRQLMGVGSTIRRTNSEVNSFEKSFSRVQRRIIVYNQLLGLLNRVNQMTLGPLKAIISTGVEFEDAFAGVIKTVDGTKEQLAKIREEFIELSKVIPVTAAELSKVGEVAGQLGIGVGSIREFTEVMVKLGVTTNLSAEQAAKAIARLANITGLSTDEYERLASSLVHLGNNTATTESAITTMALRLAGAGTTIGLTEPQILALAAAMSSVGVQSELGGSAFSRVMIEIQKAVADGGDRLRLFAKIVKEDFSPEQFAQLFKNAPGEAITRFVEGLATLAPERLFSVIDDLELGQVRVRNALIRLAKSGSLLRDTINLGTDAWIRNNALQIEAAKRFETTRSQYNLLINEMSSIGIAVFDGNREAIVGIIKALVQWIKQNEEFIRSEFSSLLKASINAANAFGSAIGFVVEQLKQLNDAGLPVLQTLLAIVSALAVKRLANTFTPLTGSLSKMPSSLVMEAEQKVVNRNLMRLDHPIKSTWEVSRTSPAELDKLNRYITARYFPERNLVTPHVGPPIVKFRGDEGFNPELPGFEYRRLGKVVHSKMDDMTPVAREKAVALAEKERLSVIRDFENRVERDRQIMSKRLTPAPLSENALKNYTSQPTTPEQFAAVNERVKHRVETRKNLDSIGVFGADTQELAGIASVTALEVLSYFMQGGGKGLSGVGGYYSEGSAVKTTVNVVEKFRSALVPVIPVLARFAGVMATRVMPTLTAGWMGAQIAKAVAVGTHTDMKREFTDDPFSERPTGFKVLFDRQQEATVESELARFDHRQEFTFDARRRRLMQRKEERDADKIDRMIKLGINQTEQKTLQLEAEVGASKEVLNNFQQILDIRGKELALSERLGASIDEIDQGSKYMADLRLAVNEKQVDFLRKQVELQKWEVQNAPDQLSREAQQGRVKLLELEGELKRAEEERFSIEIDNATEALRIEEMRRELSKFNNEEAASALGRQAEYLNAIRTHLETNQSIDESSNQTLTERITALEQINSLAAAASDLEITALQKKISDQKQYIETVRMGELDRARAVAELNDMESELNVKYLERLDMFSKMKKDLDDMRTSVEMTLMGLDNDIAKVVAQRGVETTSRDLDVALSTKGVSDSDITKAKNARILAEQNLSNVLIAQKNLEIEQLRNSTEVEEVIRRRVDLINEEINSIKQATQLKIDEINASERKGKREKKPKDDSSRLLDLQANISMEMAQRDLSVAQNKFEIMKSQEVSYDSMVKAAKEIVNAEQTVLDLRVAIKRAEIDNLDNLKMSNKERELRKRLLEEEIKTIESVTPRIEVGLEDTADKWDIALDRIIQATRGFGREFTDIIVDALHESDVSFKEFVAGMLKEINRLIIDVMITQPLFGGIEQKLLEFRKSFSDDKKKTTIVTPDDISAHENEALAMSTVDVVQPLMTDAAQSASDSFSDAAKNTESTWGTVAQYVGGGFKAVFTGLGGMLTTMFHGIFGAMGGGKGKPSVWDNALTGAIGGIFGAAGSALAGIASGIDFGSLFSSPPTFQGATPNIPALGAPAMQLLVAHDGGVVPGASDQLIRMASGEMVFPADTSNALRKLSPDSFVRRVGTMVKRKGGGGGESGDGPIINNIYPKIEVISPDPRAAANMILESMPLIEAKLAESADRGTKFGVAVGRRRAGR